MCFHGIILIFNQAFSNTLLTCTLSKIQLRADSENLFIIIVEKCKASLKFGTVGHILVVDERLVHGENTELNFRKVHLVCLGAVIQRICSGEFARFP